MTMNLQALKTPQPLVMTSFLTIGAYLSVSCKHESYMEVLDKQIHSFSCYLLNKESTTIPYCVKLEFKVYNYTPSTPHNTWKILLVIITKNLQLSNLTCIAFTSSFL